MRALNHTLSGDPDRDLGANPVMHTRAHQRAARPLLSDPAVRTQVAREVTREVEQRHASARAAADQEYADVLAGALNAIAMVEVLVRTSTDGTVSVDALRAALRGAP